MKKLLLLLLFSIVAASAFAQSTTVGPTAISGTQCLSLNVYQSGPVAITITGSWTGSIQPQVFTNPPINTTVTPVGSRDSQVAIVSNGTYTTNVTATTAFQVCGASIATGSATVTLSSIQATSSGPTSISGTQCASLNVYVSGIVQIGVAGTWGGVILPQLYTSPAVNTTVSAVGSGAAQSTITGNGNYVTTVTAPTVLNLCGASVSSGSASVTLTSAPLGGAGGGVSTSSGVVNLFTGCSGTLYLGADGACHAAGTGSVTSVSGTANQITSSGGATPVLSLPAVVTLPGTINKLTLTAPATSGTFTLADTKTFTVNNTITLAGTDAQTYTFPSTSATVARTDAANTFTGHQTIEGVTSTGATGTGAFVFATSPTLVTPVLGVATATSINKVAFTAPATGSTLVIADGKTFTASNTMTLAGTDAQTYTFPVATGTVATLNAAAQTFTNGLTAPSFTSNGAGSGVLTLNGATSGAFTVTPPSVAGTATNPALITNSLQLPSGTVYQWNADTGLSRDTAGIVDIGNGTAGNASGLLKSGNAVRVAADFTSAGNTSLQTITGLTWSLPATGTHTFSFECNLTYSQATAAAAVAFGIQAATNAPTAINASGQEGTSLTAFTTGTLRALATTTATNIVSATPSAFGAIGTAADMFRVILSGTIENPAATANTINIMISTANASDLTTVYRGSSCQLQ